MQEVPLPSEVGREAVRQVEVMERTNAAIVDRVIQEARTDVAAGNRVVPLGQDLAVVE